MPFDLHDCDFLGPALPEPYVKFELEKELNKAKLLPKDTGEEGKTLQESWNAYRRSVRDIVSSGGDIHVRNHIIEPLISRLGYNRLEASDDVETREGRENGGHLLISKDGQRTLRTWTTGFDIDLDAPSKRGQAFRFSHLRIAQRVLLATGERVGLLTNGVQLRLLISDPARPDSQIIIPIETGWRRSRDVPASYRLLLALACPEGVRFVPELVDKARLQQTKVTKELRTQARQAIEGFIQGVLNHPENQKPLSQFTDKQRLAKDLWHEGLITIYRILFILKLESTDDPARAFSFASTSLWRNTFSPTVALAPRARTAIDKNAGTGEFLEQGMRVLFRMFAHGLQCTELHVLPLGGALFGENTTPILSSLKWGERAVAHLLDRLLWTTAKRGGDGRERVHYGPLDVEDLGRVYEALLELEPGLSTESMCRLRRAKLEVVVPVAQGEKYRTSSLNPFSMNGEGTSVTAFSPSPLMERGPGGEVPDDDDTEEEEEEEETPKRGKKTMVEWIEEIPPGRFHLRVGLGRKATGSYYTPHSFVRFLVQETLGPQVAERSPHDNPKPVEILKLKVLDPAMGSGHFLVEACRFLGERLYEACRLCDEHATTAEHKAEEAKRKEDRERLLTEAQDYRKRITDLPDPDDELVRYLPSRAPEGIESGLSQRKAEALCRRLVAVHCLYGADKNPLAVELAKLSLWIESHAEGMPLTFMDHRLVVGDSLTGPFYTHLFKRPGSQQHIEGLWDKDLIPKFTAALHEAIRFVGLLEAHVGITLSQIEEKKHLKVEMDRRLAPFRVLAAAWSGGVMLGKARSDDGAYEMLLRSVADTGDLPQDLIPPAPFSIHGEGGGFSTELPASPSSFIETEIEGVTSIPSPSPCMERGTEGVRLPGITGHALVSKEKLELARKFRKEPTGAEKIAWDHLRNRQILGLKFRRQQVIEGFVVDFFCAENRLVIEIDGSVHVGEEQMLYDRARTEVLQTLGIRVVRIRNDEVTRENLENRISTDLIPPTPFSMNGEGGDRSSPSPFMEKGTEGMRSMLARGLGVEEESIPSSREELYALVDNGRCIPALSYDLTFPEVFYPTGDPHGRRGFDAVLGNPPWDAVRPKAKEFYAAYDFEILNAPTKRERTAIEKRLNEDPLVAQIHDQYIAEFDEQHKIHDCFFEWQVVKVGGEKTGGDPDLAKLFLERNSQLLGPNALTGVVVPSAFHANEGATGLRRLYLEQMALLECFSFENRRKLFEIDSRFKFANIIARRGKPTTEFKCAFYLHDDEWLFGDRGNRELAYSLDFVRKTGGEYLSLLELRSRTDAEVAEVCFKNGKPFGQMCEDLGIRFGRELHMTDDAWRFTPTAEVLPDGEDPRDPEVAKRLLEMGYLVLHEGKTFWHYEDRWEDRPKILLTLEKLKNRLETWVSYGRYYKLAFRNVSSATNERTVVSSLLIGTITSFSARTELDPRNLSDSIRLCFVAWMNSYCCDFLVRKWVNMHVDPKHLELSPIPLARPNQCLLFHSALRLTCNHSGYTPLWCEQVGDEWREPKPKHTWPVLEGDDARWELRAAIDAVVADAYGLSREQYAHVLSTFSHKSYPKAPALCLAKFDELKRLGLDTFTKNYDPYWDIPLNENLPQPVIELPVLAQEEDAKGKTKRDKTGNQMLEWD